MALRVIDAPESRTFETRCDSGSIKALRVRKATPKELGAADLEFSRIFNQSILAGLPPRARMLRKMREKQLWTSEDDQRLDELRTTVAKTEVQLADLNKKIDSFLTKDEKAVEMSTLSEDDQATVATMKAEVETLTVSRTAAFTELRQINNEVDGMLGHTADAKADESHRNFLMACVTEEVELIGSKVTKTKGRIWESVDKMNTERDVNMMQRAVYEFMMFDAGLPSEWEDKAPAPEEAPKTEEPQKDGEKVSGDATVKETAPEASPAAVSAA